MINYLTFIYFPVNFFRLIFNMFGQYYAMGRDFLALEEIET